MDCGLQEEDKLSLHRKQGAGIRRKETGSEGNYGHTCSLLKNCIEVWLIFSVALSSAAQECDSVIHIQKYIFFFLFFFMWFMTGYLIYFLMLYSRTLLFIIPLHPQLPVLPSLHPSSWQPHVLALFSCGWALISPANEKIPWYLPKEGNKTRKCADSWYLWELHIRPQADWCVSLTPPGF